jgi:hypothetical protein
MHRDLDDPPETSGTMRTTKARTLASLVYGVSRSAISVQPNSRTKSPRMTRVQRRNGSARLDGGGAVAICSG